MIVSDSRNYVYIAIPKTASAATREFLKRYYEGRSAGRYHSVDVPDKYKDKFKFTVVRNPYERCFSRWFFERYPSKPYREPKRVDYGIGFFDFMDWLKEHKYSDPMPNSLHYINMTQKEFYESAGCDAYVRLENFTEDFMSLPFVNEDDFLELPEIRVTQSKPKTSFEEYFTHNLREAKMAVREYCEADFDFFGYEV